MAVAGLCLALMAGGSLAAPVNLLKATEGYTYFNRPGAAKAEYDADLGACFSLAVSLIPGGKIYSRGKVTGDMNRMYTGAIPGLMADAQHQARAQTTLENCMVVRGWRVMLLDDARGAELWRLDRVPLDQQLAGWVGAATPPGEAVRTFANDAARRGTVMTGIPSPIGQPSLRSLSMRAFDAGKLETLPPPPPYPMPDRGSKFMARPLAADAVGAAPSDAALVVFTLSGKPERCSECIGFQRTGPTPTARAFDADGRPDLFTFDLKNTFGGEGGKTYVFALPPGRWVLGSRASLEMCLGAPSFEAKAGEVLYLGRFDLSADTFGPDMAVEAAKAQLGAAPALAAKVRAGAWTNGTVSACHNLFMIYAIEFPGFPYAPGYRQGGARPPMP